MFETATWTVENRRNFAILEHIYAELDLPLLSQDWDLAEDDQFVAALVHLVGSHLFMGTVGAANWRTGRRSGVSKRKARSTWKEVDPVLGARGCVFLTLGASALLSPRIEEGMYVDVTEHAHRMLIESFSPPPSDVATVNRVQADVARRLSEPVVKEAVERGGTIAISTVNTGQAILSYEALKIAGADPALTPMYADVAHLDQTDWFDVMGFDWMMLQDIGPLPRHWKSGKEELLELISLRPT